MLSHRLRTSACPRSVYFQPIPKLDATPDELCDMNASDLGVVQVSLRTGLIFNIRPRYWDHNDRSLKAKYGQGPAVRGLINVIDPISDHFWYSALINHWYSALINQERLESPDGIPLTVVNQRCEQDRSYPGHHFCRRIEEGVHGLDDIIIWNVVSDNQAALAIDALSLDLLVYQRAPSTDEINGVIADRVLWDMMDVKTKPVIISGTNIIHQFCCWGMPLTFFAST